MFETKFLGIIISKDSIRMDLKKIKTITEWKTPSYLINI
jgi:hypothetical protein